MDVVNTTGDKIVETLWGLYGKKYEYTREGSKMRTVDGKKRREGETEGKEIKGIYRHEEESEIRIRDCSTKKSKCRGEKRQNWMTVKRKVKVNKEGGGGERTGRKRRVEKKSGGKRR